MSTAGDGARPVVMVVDDDDVLRSYLQELLEGEGYTTIVASNGREALKRMSDGVPDIVLTDLVMPECEGVELMQSVRREIGPVPVIAMSGGRRMSSTYLEVADRLGADATLAKPFKARELLDTIERILADA
ncbi:MAG: response regulator [Ectothiorhodospiraceae bacterium]|nr:response regulator [Ectothiorhodospiraceae bacterium]